MPLILNPIIQPVTPDLVSPARAQQNPQLAKLYASNPGYFTSLVAAASNSVRRYCHRDFTVQDYREYYSGVPNQYILRLRQFPVVRIASVGVATGAMQVQNNGTYVEATVETTGTAVVLVGTNNAISTTTTFLYANYPTVQAMANAIMALNTGWSCSIQSGSYGSFSSYGCNRFKRTQGASTALLGGTFLEIYEAWYPGASGWSTFDQGDWGAWTGNAGWRLDEQTGELAGRWPRGRQNIEVRYQAGFTEIPEAVQEAVVQLAAFTNNAGNVNLAITSLRLGDYAQSNATNLKIPPYISNMLDPFKAYDKVIAH